MDSVTFETVCKKDFWPQPHYSSSPLNIILFNGDKLSAHGLCVLYSANLAS